MFKIFFECFTTKLPLCEKSKMYILREHLFQVLLHNDYYLEALTKIQHSTDATTDLEC